MSDRPGLGRQGLEDGTAGGNLVDPVQHGAGWRLQQRLEARFQFRAHETARRAQHFAQVGGARAGGAASVPVEPFDGPALGAGTVGGGMLGPAGLAQGLALGVRPLARKIPPQSAQGLGLLPQFPHSGSPVAVRLLMRRCLPQLAHTASSRSLALQGRHLGASVEAK